MQETNPSHLSLFTNTILSGLKAWTSYNCHPLHIHGIHLLLMPSVLCPGLIMIYRAIWLLPALSTAPSILAQVSAESQLWGCVYHLWMLGVKLLEHRVVLGLVLLLMLLSLLVQWWKIVSISFYHISYHYHAPKLHLLQTNLVGSDLWWITHDLVLN